MKVRSGGEEVANRWEKMATKRRDGIEVKWTGGVKEIKITKIIKYQIIADHH